MNWRECKLIALQTMFSNEGADINADDSNQDYIDAMPGKANEAMQQLATVGRPILKQFQIAIETGAEEAVTEEKVTLPAAEVRYKLKLTAYCPRFRCLEPQRLMLDSGGVYDQADDWDLEGDDVLVLPGNITGTYTIWYAAYPQVIDAGTPDDTVIELAPEAAALIPLYIAAELYKEDELAMATMFRNEFEDGLAKLQLSYAASGGAFRCGRTRNTTGWW
ncbi:hypothetical protein [uncultured Dysosmobacter sp.]|uniref:phage adaptor protein n=1 Tax=uncultured Dysosmobacter sp. TaxID=2591384 RepID=UPI00261BF332|nr:hypothetical protein [uncultured Dysosmobacter sp.]